MTLNGLFDHLEFWHWWIFAIILFILEVFSPGAFFVWMGTAAGVTGLALLVIPSMSWELQFIIFSIFSVVSILVGRTYFHREASQIEDPTLSELETSLIGKSCEVETSIRNGSGRVKLGDTTWKASGPDAEVGESVTIVRVNGAELIIEKN